MRDIVRLCNKYNISVLLDSHQDALSKKMCGEGIPDWAVESRSEKEQFPYPLKLDIKKDD